MIKTDQLIDQIAKHSVPFKETQDLKPLINKASNAKYVLLGEASHGTSEFYTVRAEISKKLIKEHGFSFIAVEGDWPACYEVNRYIKGMTSDYTSAEDVLKKSFNRWPSWMWANREMIDLIEWLRSYNEQLEGHKVGFYGIDVYSLWESMEAIVDYFKKINSPEIEKALNAIECFEPFQRKAEQYGISAAFYGEDCMSEVMELLQTIQQNRKMYEEDPEAALSLKINAIAASNAEHYYHTMVTNDSESWNIRDRHMAEALHYIGSYYGANAKGIVWEHNTHIGDARATDMASEGMVNVGQLTREQYGEENVYAVGFGSYEGTVIAAERWGDPAKVMPVPKGASGSWESVVHKAGATNKFIMFNDENKQYFQDIIGHRAIGVVYHPQFEHHGNYVPTRLSDRYDAFIHIDQTKALSPLGKS
ncbi:erythromycin esterase family protein [Anaerobacillus alkaliphilus]|uniref:Erythromycin esterase family protein n=1 Tax=Anaerobacillus alkaliphilus TaxID=1548597 RepID=A0A4Q0VSF7_9BACI|nr:erythromycin esterase family protein [Anaerobacillus alkaliphilus]RXJ00276.1 erythromycin esterase family protein [Anaerobacillus alkaliphilus]